MGRRESSVEKGSVQETRRDDDDERHDHRTEEVGHAGEPKSKSRNSPCREIGVLHLECHTDGKRELGKVKVGGASASFGINPTFCGDSEISCSDA